MPNPIHKANAMRSLSLCCLSLLFFFAALRPVCAVPKVLLNAPFAPGLKGWHTSGEAEFAFENHEGRPSARITVPEKAPLQYQQLQFDVTNDIKQGDTFQGGVSVRSLGLHDGAGAYIVLEFLDSRGQRAGIENGAPSFNVGSGYWERLRITGVAPAHTAAMRFSLIVHAHGTAWFAAPRLVRTLRVTAWPNLGNALRTLTVFPHKILQPRFLGAGFDTFQHNFPATPQELNEVLFKRWAELAPSFARLDLMTAWGHEELDKMALHILKMKQSGTVVYVTLWDLPAEKTPQDRTAFAEHTADQLEYLIKTKGCTNIRYFCLSNELSLDGWGALAHNMPLYAQYQQALFSAFQKQGLKVGLLATDASPISLWTTIQWAADHINPITAVYGGHHYFSEYTPDDSRFYPWFLSQLQWITGVAAGKQKGFVLGEFGCRGDGRTIEGVLHDDCFYWNTLQEPYTGLQLAEAVIASLNSGTKALAYWTFTDFPFTPGQSYQNYWGMFQWENGHYAPRDPYFAYGLMTRWFRGPSESCATAAADPRLRIGALKHKNGWSIAVVNRNHTAVNIALKMAGLPLNARFRRYLYDTAHIPSSPFGDLPPPTATPVMKNGLLHDTIGPESLVVYTSDYRSEIPAQPAGLVVQKEAKGVRLSWKQGSALYYRIYRRASPAAAYSEIGTTIADHFTDLSAGPSEDYYEVRAADRWDNLSPPARIAVSLSTVGTGK